MGKSTSCFKIITCGGDFAENNDVIHVPEPEIKKSNDKKGWSFRKRSERHRVLSNTVRQEATSGLKESPASAGLNFQQPDASIIPEETSTIEYSEEKPQALTPKEHIEEESKCVASKGYTEEKSQLLIPEDSKVPEPAHKELEKLKNLVKLQAAVRGHLVRRHALGTLRCIQAIVKMQVLVRARLSQEGSYDEKKRDGKHCGENQSLERSAIKQNATYTSIENLLSNRFARKLMDSTQKTKPIRIKCDPSKPNSAWSWLERWMSVSLSKKPSTTELSIEQPEREKSDNCDFQVTTTVPESFPESNEPKLYVRETLVSSESEENLIAHDAANSKFEACQTTSSTVMDYLEQPQIDNSTSDIKEEGEENRITYDTADFKFEACQPTSSSLMDDLEQPQIDNSASDLKQTSQETNSQDQMMQREAHSETEVSFHSSKPEIESEQPKRTTKRFASEQLETEAKKFVFKSRKGSNPAFIAAQTKFEELSSTAYSSRSVDSSHQDVGVESNLDTVSSGADMSRSKEPSITENAVLNNRRGQYGDSECGTAVSITSTLDSPDKSEVGTIEYEHGAKVSELENCSSNSINDLDVKENHASAITMPDSSLSIAEQPKKLDDAKGESVGLIVADSTQIGQEPLEGTSDLQRELDSETGNQAYRLSPEASPGSQMIVPASQGTPSSEVSVKAKKKRTDKSSQKRKSLSADKSSPSTPAHDSGARSSTEQLPKDQKNGKIRNSLGSTRPENIDDEPRDSDNSTSLPHFMQATESARAKVNAKNSPRSSPDVQDRDIYIKKRHSLPAANGRQGSPRITRSVAKAQQGAKENGSTNPIHGMF
ncbi:protein IQ-DOMAIN 32-like isoform X2 [Gossypium australe]|uniref:Protein IQ-DOMAIN 32-like isoform X2 n=1 Tax=Gossypium australe TaxID=47621 RepID=A0A5B6X3V3_9ROSI|nr:protein IQ-DOMAIN 32-like isoform X2 [Gossypium australe]